MRKVLWAILVILPVVLGILSTVFACISYNKEVVSLHPYKPYTVTSDTPVVISTKSVVKVNYDNIYSTVIAGTSKKLPAGNFTLYSPYNTVVEILKQNTFYNYAGILVALSIIVSFLLLIFALACENDTLLITSGGGIVLSILSFALLIGHVTF